jgi:DNA-binding XRE family transcriptional regulator
VRKGFLKITCKSLILPAYRLRRAFLLWPPGEGGAFYLRVYLLFKTKEVRRMGNVTKEDIKKIRRLYGLSQYDMAKLLKISQPAVFQIEKGYINISEMTEQKLIKQFNLNQDKLALIRGIYAQFNGKIGNTRS